MAKERDELLDKYSARVFKNRKNHITQLEFGDARLLLRRVQGRCCRTDEGCCRDYPWAHWMCILFMGYQKE